MSRLRGSSRWRGWLALGFTLLALGGCGSNPPATPTAIALAPTDAHSATPVTPAPSASSPYGNEWRWPRWQLLNDTDAEANIEIHEGEKFASLWVLPPHTWTYTGYARGHVDGTPDLSAHLLDEACRELDAVPMVGWEEVFTIVIAPSGTLSIDTWKPGDDETVFSPPRSTFAPAMPQPPCGVDYTSSQSPSPS